MSELSFAAVAQAFDAPDAEERRQATSRLGELVPAEALPLLVRALGDVDWRVRKEATVAARAFAGDPALVAALVPVLEPGENVGLRNAAVDVLASEGAAATPAITAAMPRLDADGRKLAVEVLGRSRDPEALAPLASALDDEDVNVRQSAIEAIARLESSSCEPVRRELLTRCLDDADPYVRLTALEGLSALGVSVPWERLERFIDDPTLRSAALSAAALSDSPRAAPVLARALASARGRAFDEALGALARLAGYEGADDDLAGAAAPSGAAAQVAEALRTQGDAVAARLLDVAGGVEADGPVGAGRLGARAEALALAALARVPGAVDAAIHALGEQALAPAAHRALTLLGPAALPGLASALSRSGGEIETGVRAALIDVVASGPLGGGAGALLPALRQAARDADRRVAASALVALARLGEAADLELAAALSVGVTPPVAHAAEACLAKLSARFPEAARAVARSASTEQARWLAAAVVLGALGGGAAPTLGGPGGDLAFLTQAVAAEDARTRAAAALAVAEIGGSSAFDVLGFALADEERDVQLAAARGLGRLCAARGGRRSAPPPAPAAVLDLVERSRDADLVAATVRAIGDRIADRPAAPGGGERAPQGPAPADDPAVAALVAALTPLCARGASSVAMAAVDALGRAEGAGRTKALAGALTHPDPEVVKAAMLKLGGSEGRELGRCLDHPSTEVRLLAAEMLAYSSDPATRDRLSQRAAVEHDRDVKDAIDSTLYALSRTAPRTHET